MKKNELIEQMAIRAGISKASAHKAMEAFIESTSKALQNGDKVSLGGFGTWSVYVSAKRLGRNPKTGESITIASKNRIKFKASTQLLSTL